MSRFSRGSSMAEYGVIAALVAIAIVGICITLGGGINNKILGFKGDMRGHVQKAAYGEIMEKWGDGNGIGLGGAAQYPSPAGTTAHCFSNGICLNIPDASGTTATMGSNGGELTEAYSNVFSQLVKQLEAANADPALVAIIKKMAKNGHTLADSEQAVIDICPPGQDCKTSDTDKSSDKVFDLQLKIPSGQDDFQRAKNELNKYLKNHPSALSSDLVAVINVSSWNINEVASTFGHITGEFEGSVGQSDDNQGPSFEVSYDLKAGQLTHLNADTIHATVLP